MRKVLSTLLTLALLASLMGCSKEVEPMDELPGMRSHNVDNVTVVDESGEWRIDQGKVYLSGEEIEVGKLAPAPETSLSVIDGCIYVHSDQGLQRYDLEKKSTEMLYYDLMDFSFAGLVSLYYVHGTDLYRIETVEESIPVASQVVQDVYLLNENFFYFVAGDTIKSINLETDEVHDFKAITSPVTGISISAGTLVVATVDGDVRVSLTEEEK